MDCLAKNRYKEKYKSSTNPNDIEFNYYKARALSKDIGKCIYILCIILYNI